MTLLRSTPLLAALVGLLMAVPPCATAQVADSTAATGSVVRARDAVVAGGFVLAAVLAAPEDARLASHFQSPSVQTNHFLRGAARGFRQLGQPGTEIASVGLYGLGRLGTHSQLADVGLHTGESIVLGGLAGVAIKMAAGRARPYVNIDDPHSFAFGRGFKGDQYQSLPSGHTIVAFAFASSMTEETAQRWPSGRWYVGAASYGAATLVGLSRMYTNDHWASDVVAGAAVGTFAGMTVVRYNRAHRDNRLDRMMLSLATDRAPDGRMMYGFRALLPLDAR